LVLLNHLLKDHDIKS